MNYFEQSVYTPDIQTNKNIKNSLSYYLLTCVVSANYWIFVPLSWLKLIDYYLLRECVAGIICYLLLYEIEIDFYLPLNIYGKWISSLYSCNVNTKPKFKVAICQLFIAWKLIVGVYYPLVLHRIFPCSVYECFSIPNYTSIFKIYKITVLAFMFKI